MNEAFNIGRYSASVDMRKVYPFHCIDSRNNATRISEGQIEDIFHDMT